MPITALDSLPYSLPRTIILAVLKMVSHGKLLMAAESNSNFFILLIIYN